MFTDSYKPQVNGVVRSVDVFTDNLRKKGHEVHIFAPEIPDYKGSEKNVHRIKSVEFRGYKEYRIGLPFKMLLLQPFGKTKPDVIHVHSPFSMGVIGLRLAKHYKIPCVGTFHTMFPEYAHYFLKYDRLQKSKLVTRMFKKGAWKYLNWFYGKCDVVIAPTEKIKNVLKNHGIENVTAIPTGVEIKAVKKSKSRLRKEYGLSNNEKIILHVGRITREKNVGFIISSLSGLLKSGCKMIITSDGPYREKLVKTVADLGLGESVIFTGYIPDNQLQEYYRLSDVFVMASTTETQGLVLLEAAVNGLPVVALDSQVTGDIVRETNIGVVSNRKDFAKKVALTLRGRKRPEMENISRKFGIEKCVSDLINVYSRLAGGSQ
ncbi:glycosyltransferase [Candidatus Woesearchaeota archaeon]|nr:glycosyltransferase [Candidatus Woesearchaeota archaeon]